LQYNDYQLASLKEQASGGEVYQILRRAIEELYLQPGAVLSIKDICEHFEIGRSPVRDALIRLDQEGLVTLLPQRGTMISRIDLARVEQERFLRLSVEEEVMKLFMACHTPSDITLLNEALRRQQELLDRKEVDMREFLLRDDEFHEVFYAVADKLFCLRAIQNVWGHYRRMRLLTCGTDSGLQEVIRQHSALIAAMQARDTELMRNIFLVHLRKLDREERSLLKKYPYLFKGADDRESVNPRLRADYLQTLRMEKGII
jgi:DNA-binding GntR family transcriptional regulator